MTTKSAIITGISLILASLILGYFHYESRMGGKSVKVVGSASKPFEADTVKWRFTIAASTGTENISAGYKLLRENTDRIIGQIKNAGISQDNISVQPVTSFPNYNNQGQISGYRVQQPVFVISEDLQTIENLALNPDKLFTGGISFEMSSLEYFYSKVDEIKKELLGSATQDAKERASEIAKSSGLKVGNLISARTGVFQITEPFSTEISDYGVNSTSTRKKEIKVTVHAEFRIE